MEEQKGVRYNSGKLKWSLVDFKAMEPLVRVLEFGAQKYSAHNWKKGLDKVEILESLVRHATELLQAEVENDNERKLDIESKINHIGHIMCNCMFYSYFNQITNSESTGNT